MLHDDNNYNKGEDLDHCAVCNKQFVEDEPVGVVEFKNGPFRIVCDPCKMKLREVTSDNKQNNQMDERKDYHDLKPEDKLWRYMDLSKFICLLKDSALYFSAPAAFNDIYEGAHGELRNKKAWDDFYMSHARAIQITAPDNRWHRIEKSILDSNSKRLVASISKRPKYIYINCWHLNDFESEAMWKVYSKDISNAIVIQTTFAKLQDEVDKNASIRKVRYVDYSKRFIGSNDEYIFKRKSFEYENEVRVILHNFNKSSSGVPMKVNVESLIENVYISPYAPAWFVPLVSDLVERYGYKINVEKSTMAETPF